MDRRLLNYLPPVLREVLEFQAISTAAEPEISAAWDALDRLMANQFLDSADSAGVSIWERELGIQPKGADTLESRKARVKAAWNSGSPYSFNWLKNWLRDICGASACSVEINGYALSVNLPISVDYTSILNTLERRIPSNIYISPVLMLKEKDTSFTVGLAFSSTVKITTDKPSIGINILTNEDGVVLTDELGSALYLEETI